MHRTHTRPDVEGIANRLRASYGELLLLTETARELRKSVGTLKVTLASPRRRERYPWARRLADSRVRMGRRVYFPAAVVAEVIAFGDAVELDADQPQHGDAA